MEKYKRIFVVVMDSLGVGAMPDSESFGDVGVNTLGHISESVDSFTIPNLQKLGMAQPVQLKAGAACRASFGLPGKAAGKEPGKRYHDRPLGDDGPGGDQTV